MPKLVKVIKGLAIIGGGILDPFIRLITFGREGRRPEEDFTPDKFEGELEPNQLEPLTRTLGAADRRNFFKGALRFENVPENVSVEIEEDGGIETQVDRGMSLSTP